MERKSECKISLGPCKPLLFYLELKQMILSYCSLCDNSHFYMPLNTLLKIPKALRRILKQAERGKIDEKGEREGGEREYECACV